MNSSTSIQSVRAREILDSRGWPTVEADVTLAGGAFGRAMVPSGASTGGSEALELRDGDLSRFAGRGVRRAVSNVNELIAPALTGRDAVDQARIDQLMIELDGTENKSRLGANAVLAVSCAAARAASAAATIPLFRYVSSFDGVGDSRLSIPLPMINILSGGLHAEGALDFQDFLIICAGAESYMQCLEWTSSIWWRTRRLLAGRGFSHLGVADEGGFGAPLPSNEAALQILTEAVESCSLVPGRDVFYAVDVASTHCFDPATRRYQLKSESRNLSAADMTDYLATLRERYPIISIEDPLHEEAWDDWRGLTDRLGGRMQIIGDDLFTTNPRRLERGITSSAANSILIKINQIGTLTEAHRVLRRAQEAGLTTVLSARSGETEDSLMSDLAVGWNAGQIKIGSLSRSSRLAKYNQLLRIEEQLDANGDGAWTGAHPLNRWLSAAKQQ